LQVLFSYSRGRTTFSTKKVGAYSPGLERTKASAEDFRAEADGGLNPMFLVVGFSTWLRSGVR